MSTQPQVTSEERIFSLLLALASSRSGVTKNELLSTVHGYAQRFHDTSQRESLERQFERDKDSLRELGIPIETFDSPEASGNNQLTRYRVQRDALELPENLSFTTRELSLLRLASFAWRESTLALDSRRASMKLAALGVDIDADLIGYAPRISTHDHAFAPLQRALAEGLIVEFAYQKPGEDQPVMRRVAPLALEHIDGRWHLLSWDFVRADARVFLLSRIVSTVKQTRELFDAALSQHIEPLLLGLHERAENQLAVVSVQPLSEAAARLTPLARSSTPRGEDNEGMIELTIPFLDEAVFAEELVAFGSEVFVSEPRSLREHVIELLSQIRHMHIDRSGLDG